MNRSARSEYYVGALLVVVSAVTSGTAGLFTKGVEAGPWDVIFWRGFFAAMFGSPFEVERVEIYVLSAFGLLFAVLFSIRNDT